MVVRIPGGYEVVAADSFNRLFRLAEASETEPEKVAGIDPKLSAAPHPWSKKGKAQLDLRKKKVAKPVESSEPSKTVGIVKQAPVAGAGGENTSELRTTEAMLQAVGEAPRTSAETQDRVCVIMGWPTTERKYRDRVYQSIWAAIQAGKVEKRSDPSTQIPHLYLVGVK